MLTLDDLDELERCAEPIRASPSGGAQQVTRTATFEQAAAPYRGLVRSARRLLLRGQRIGAELERELRHGARALSLARRRLSQLTSRS